jgi:hypothetical protein
MSTDDVHFEVWEEGPVRARLRAYRWVDGSVGHMGHTGNVVEFRSRTQAEKVAGRSQGRVVRKVATYGTGLRWAPPHSLRPTDESWTLFDYGAVVVGFIDLDHDQWFGFVVGVGGIGPFETFEQATAAVETGVKATWT